MFKSRRAAIVVPAFFTLNTLLSMMNRWALGHKGFKFPLVLTISQACVSFSFTLAMLSFFPGTLDRYKKVAQKEWKGIFIVGFWVAANISLNNLSLVHLSLSLNQIIRATIPLVTAIVSSLSEKKIPPRTELIGLCLLCFGVTVAISEAAAAGDTFGVTLCILSVFAGAAMLTSSARVLAGKVDSVQLAFFTSPVICLCLFPPFFLKERLSFSRYVVHSPGATLAILLSGSLVAGMYNIVHTDLVAITDPVTTTVLGQVKIVGIMVLSAVFLGEGKDFTMRMLVGCSMAVLGFSIFSWAKAQHSMIKKDSTKSKDSTKPAAIRNLRVLVHEEEPTTPGLKTRSSNRLHKHSTETHTPRQVLPGTKTPSSAIKSNSDVSNDGSALSTSVRRSLRRKSTIDTPGKFV